MQRVVVHRAPGHVQRDESTGDLTERARGVRVRARSRERELDRGRPRRRRRRREERRQRARRLLRAQLPAPPEV